MLSFIVADAVVEVSFDYERGDYTLTISKGDVINRYTIKPDYNEDPDDMEVSLTDAITNKIINKLKYPPTRMRDSINRFIVNCITRLLMDDEDIRAN